MLIVGLTVFCFSLLLLLSEITITSFSVLAKFGLHHKLIDGYVVDWPELNISEALHIFEWTWFDSDFLRLLNKLTRANVRKSCFVSVVSNIVADN